MKVLLTCLGILFVVNSYAQNTMFWNNYAALNPATSGLVNYQDAYVNFYDQVRIKPNPIQSMSANYNLRLADRFGLGIRYDGDYFYNGRNDIGLNYNFQQRTGRNGTIALGAGIEFSHVKLNQEFIDELDDAIAYVPSSKNIYVNFGIAYSWKKLLVGATVSNVTEPSVHLGVAPPYETAIGYSGFISYDFRIGKNYMLTPRGTLSISDGFIDHNLDITLSYLNKFSLGLIASTFSNAGVHLGWDIKEKYRIAYLYNHRFLVLQQANSSYHQLTIGFIMQQKKPRKKTFEMGSPDF